MKRKGRQRTFSIELMSERNLHLEIGKKDNSHVLIEGNLGELIHLEFIEAAVLEMKASEGVLRVDLPLREITLAAKEA